MQSIVVLLLLQAAPISMLFSAESGRPVIILLLFYFAQAQGE
jgi:hypothetical protein